MAITRVLIADDDAAVLKMCERTLRGAGFVVETVPDGVSALSKIETSVFDVMLSDIQMPGMDGLKLLRAIRSRDLELPVIFMTGDPNVKTAAAAVKYGALGYLPKPVDRDLLIREIAGAAHLGRLSRIKQEALRHVYRNAYLAGDLAGLEGAYERALSSLWVAYQPIVDFRNQRVFGYEALARTKDDTIPHVGALLDAGERLGKLRAFGRAMREIVVPPGPLPGDGNLFINLHASDLEDEDLFRRDSAVAVAAGRIVLEITERATLDAMDDVPGKVRALKEMGFRIAIDDLGAGYAGLASFSQLKPDIVKLDMELIRNLHEDPVKQKVVQAMTRVCKDMGILVVAEGVEIVQERDLLLELECDLLQGYLLGRPDKELKTPGW